MFAYSQYITAVEHLDVMSRSLREEQIYPTTDTQGKVKCWVGNSVVIVEVMHNGVHKALRNYTRQHPNLRAIYGENYYPNELMVSVSASKGRLVDVVLCEWREGVTLQSKIEQFASSPTKMEALSRYFEEWALELLDKEWAHGDIKPDNIIIGKDGLQLIDFDAMYRPDFAEEDCVEVGTSLFQHPKRDRKCFDVHIDDYPIALIATALAAMAKNRLLTKLLLDDDHLLISPKLAIEGRDKVLDRIEKLFAKRGDARHYRIAQLLRSQSYELLQLRELLATKPASPAPPEPPEPKPLRKGSVADVTIFANSLAKIVNTMRQTGYNPITEQKETDNFIEYRILIPK
jgi:serine/threonine protein kinase